MESEKLITEFEDGRTDLLTSLLDAGVPASSETQME